MACPFRMEVGDILISKFYIVQEHFSDSSLALWQDKFKIHEIFSNLNNPI